MNTAPLSPIALVSTDSSCTIAYLWLLVLGFSPNEAAASLAPELFTQEPSRLSCEYRPRAPANCPT